MFTEAFLLYIPLFSISDKALTDQIVTLKGYCTTNNNIDQNNGVIKIDNINADTEDSRNKCLQKCLTYSNATGCEVTWNQRNQMNTGCYVHSSEVANANGADRHTCWVFKSKFIRNHL